MSPVPYPQVALEFMNRDHAEFAAMRARLLELLSGPVSAPAVDAALVELGEHTRRHFTDEERLMREIDFPPYEVHKGEHERVLADVAAQVERWKHERDADALRAWLDRTLGTWLFDHVSSMDFVTAAFAAGKQRSG